MAIEPERNVLDAVYSLIHNRAVSVNPSDLDDPGALPGGVTFEKYVKDLIAGVDSSVDGKAKSEAAYKTTFAFQGGARTRPDVLLFGGDTGDAIELKKTQSLSAPTLHLNSSAPKDCLLISDVLASAKLRKCEPGWSRRTLLYVVGCIPKGTKSLRWLWCFDASLTTKSADCFAEVFRRVQTHLHQHKDVSEDTNELGRVKNAAGAAGVTMRIRAMWTTPGPWVLFKAVPGVEGPPTDDGLFVLHALFRRDRWTQYPEGSRRKIMELINQGVSINDRLTIPDPNSDSEIEAVLVRWEFRRSRG